MVIVDMRGKINSPNDPVTIRWEVDGSSGTTRCEAWRAQHEIERLEAAGYTVATVEVEA